MKSKNQLFEIANIDVVEVTVDVSSISKTGDMFFNATEIANQFGKKTGDFLRLESTDQYINEILAESRSGISRYADLVRSKQGGKNQGTWLHKELAFEFAGWKETGFFTHSG